MKKSVLTICILFLSSILFAQKVRVENNIENIGDGYNMSFKLNIPYADIKTSTKKWTQFLKDNHSKIRSSKGAINAQNMVINGMGSDSITVFSRITENDSGCVLLAAFKRNGTYIAPATDQHDTDLMTKLLMDIGKELSLQGIEDRTKAATKVLTTKTKEQSELTKSNEKMTSENEKMKKKMSDNDKVISSNTERLEDLKKEISKQNDAIETIKSKTKEID